MYVKLRKRMSHREGQYEKEAVTESKIITVQENGLQFLVNLTDYLDTGLFLDHRVTRQMVASRSKGYPFFKPLLVLIPVPFLCMQQKQVLNQLHR